MRQTKYMYAIRYQLGARPIRPHRTFAAALRDLRSCESVARRNGDKQGITIVRSDNQPLTDNETAQINGY